MRQFSRIALIAGFAAGCSAAVDNQDQEQAPQEDPAEYPTREVVAPEPEAPTHVCDDLDPCTEDYQPQPGNCGHRMIRSCGVDI